MRKNISSISLCVAVTVLIVVCLVGRVGAQPQGWTTYSYQDPKTGNLTRFYYPETWAASGHSGMADVWSAQGDKVALGIWAPVTTPEGYQAFLARTREGLRGLPPAQAEMYMQRIIAEQEKNPVPPSPYLSPRAVVTKLLPKVVARMGNSIRNVQVLQEIKLQPPALNPTGMQSSIFRVNYVYNNVPYRGILNVSSAWVHRPSQWMFSYSSVGAPAARFAQTLPTMLGIWKSYLSMTVRRDWASDPVRKRMEEMERWAEAWDRYIRQ